MIRIRDFRNFRCFDQQVIRNDARLDYMPMQYRLAQPVMQSRIAGASLIRERWEAEKRNRNDI